MTHTPGPWAIAPGNFIVHDFRHNQPESGLIVAEIPCQKGNPADLALIAAAPHLLEALEATLHYCETPGDFTPEEHLQLCEDAALAIAKAKGE